MIRIGWFLLTITLSEKCTNFLTGIKNYNHHKYFQSTTDYKTVTEVSREAEHFFIQHLDVNYEKGIIPWNGKTSVRNVCPRLHASFAYLNGSFFCCGGISIPDEDLSNRWSPRTEPRYDCRVSTGVLGEPYEISHQPIPKKSSFGLARCSFFHPENFDPVRLISRRPTFTSILSIGSFMFLVNSFNQLLQFKKTEKYELFESTVKIDGFVPMTNKLILREKCYYSGSRTFCYSSEYENKGRYWNETCFQHCVVGKPIPETKCTSILANLWFSNKFVEQFRNEDGKIIYTRHALPESMRKLDEKRERPRMLDFKVCDKNLMYFYMLNKRFQYYFAEELKTQTKSRNYDVKSVNLQDFQPPIQINTESTCENSCDFNAFGFDLNIVICEDKKCKIYNDENHDIDYYSAEVESDFKISNCSVSDQKSLCYLSYSEDIVNLQFEDKILLTVITIFLIALYVYIRRVFSKRDHYGFRNWNLLVNEGMLQGIRVVGKPIFGGSSYVFEAYLQDEKESEEIYEFGHPSLGHGLKKFYSYSQQ